MVMFRFKNTVQGTESSIVKTCRLLALLLGCMKVSTAECHWDRARAILQVGPQSHADQSSVARPAQLHTHAAFSPRCQQPPQHFSPKLAADVWWAKYKEWSRSSNVPSRPGGKTSCRVVSTSAQERRWNRLAQSHYLFEGCLLRWQKRDTNRSVHQLSLEKLCQTRLYDRQRPHSEDKCAQHTAQLLHVMTHTTDCCSA